MAHTGTATKSAVYLGKQVISSGSILFTGKAARYPSTTCAEGQRLSLEASKAVVVSENAQDDR
jgi:hypothetical protein